MEFVRLRVEVKEEVVAISRVPTRETQQSFSSPEAVKGIQINQWSNDSLIIVLFNWISATISMSELFMPPLSP